jgi:hypothetical protein
VEKKDTHKSNDKASGGDLTPMRQPLSAAKYAVHSLLLLAVGSAFVWFYVAWAPKLGADLDRRVYFIVLIVWGLVCASYLVGAMRGNLVIRYKGLVASGQIAVLLVILGLGMKFAPDVPPAFDLTVRLCELDGKTPILKPGIVILDLNNDRRSEEIGTKGEANFKGIPGGLRGRTITVLPKVNGYEENPKMLQVSGSVLCIPLTPDPKSQAAGRIKELMESEAKLVLSNSRDAAAAERYGALFAENATLSDSGPPAYTWHRRGDIMVRFRRLPHFVDLRHKLTSEPSIKSNDSATAEAITEYLIENPGPNQNPNGSGNERWTFVKEGDQWKIQSFRYNVPQT